jgi:hypothetical protein
MWSAKWWTRRKSLNRSLFRTFSTTFSKRQLLLVKFRRLANSIALRSHCPVLLGRRETLWHFVGRLIKFCRSIAQCTTLLQTIPSLECSKLHPSHTTFTSPTLLHPWLKTRSSISLIEQLNYNIWSLSLGRGS